MARNNQSNRLYNKVFFGKVVGFKPNDTKEPGVELKAKGDDGSYKVVETTSQISGCISKIELSEYEYQGDNIQTFSITFVDDEIKENYVVNFNFNNASRGVLNCLATAPDFTLPVRLSFYRNKSGYASIFIEQEKLDSTWEKLPYKWEYEKHIAPMVKTVRIGKKEMKDYSKVDEAFIKLLNDVILKKEFYGGTKDSDPAISSKFENVEKPEKPQPSDDETSDDLPF